MLAHSVGSLERSGFGPIGYPFVKMIKAILLQQWYHLSDPELEEALRVRIDFMVFTEFEGDIPDETTLCRFRNKLIEKGSDKILFQEVNKQLEHLDLKVKPCDGAIIDATIISSASRPRRMADTVIEDRSEPVKASNKKLFFS